jgi:hypothetical protein
VRFPTSRTPSDQRILRRHAFHSFDHSRRHLAMTVKGHSRPMQPVLPIGSCPLRSNSNQALRRRELT